VPCDPSVVVLSIHDPFASSSLSSKLKENQDRFNYSIVNAHAFSLGQALKRLRSGNGRGKGRCGSIRDEWTLLHSVFHK
jgi:hypothetical protein